MLGIATPTRVNACYSQARTGSTVTRPRCVWDTPVAPVTLATLANFSAQKALWRRRVMPHSGSNAIWCMGIEDTVKVLRMKPQDLATTTAELH